MDFGIDGARQRVIEAMRSGRWEAVDEMLTRYAGAVRAEERYLAIGEAVEALQECAGDDDDTPARNCIAMIERLR